MQSLSFRSGIGGADASKSTSTPSRFRKSGLAAAIGATAVLAAAPLKTANASIDYYSGILNQSAAIGQTQSVAIGTKTLFSFTNATSGKGEAYLYLTPNAASDVNAKFAALATSTTTTDDKSGATITTANYTVTEGHQLTANYGKGTSIGAASIFTTDPNPYFDYYFGPNALDTPADLYVGFEININNADNSGILGQNYGWAQFTVGAGNTPFTLVNYALTYNAPILTGDTGAPVPEPASLSILAIGGVGLLSRRSRRGTTFTR